MITVEPLYEEEGCSSAALVRFGGGKSAFHHDGGRLDAWVTAEDPGHLVRTQVMVDAIHQLQIVSRTHELVIDSHPLEFSVRGYDKKGNEFSSMEGLVFRWDAKQGEVLRMVKFQDYPYAVSPHIKELERQGLQGCKVLFEGIKTGSSKVSVALVSKAPVRVPAADITVIVIENLILLPQVAYVMIGATVDYHAEQLKYNMVS